MNLRPSKTRRGSKSTIWSWRISRSMRIARVSSHNRVWVSIHRWRRGSNPRIQVNDQGETSLNLRRGSTIQKLRSINWEPAMIWILRWSQRLRIVQRSAKNEMRANQAYIKLIVNQRIREWLVHRYQIRTKTYRGKAKDFKVTKWTVTHKMKGAVGHCGIRAATPIHCMRMSLHIKNQGTRICKMEQIYEDQMRTWRWLLKAGIVAMGRLLEMERTAHRLKVPYLMENLEEPTKTSQMEWKVSRRLRARRTWRNLPRMTLMKKMVSLHAQMKRVDSGKWAGPSKVRNHRRWPNLSLDSRINKIIDNVTKEAPKIRMQKAHLQKVQAKRTKNLPMRHH